MDNGVNIDGFDWGMEFLCGNEQASEQISTTIEEVKKAVNREIQAHIAAVVEEVKSIMLASTPSLVEAVKRGITEAALPALVEAAVQKGMQASMSSMVEEMKMAGTFLPSILPSSSRGCPKEGEAQGTRGSNTSRSLQLHIQSQLPERMFTGKKLHEQGASLKVVLCDNSGVLVEVGPESSTKIKLVVLHGDFTAEDRDDLTAKEFNENVLQQRDGKPPLLVGKCEIPLSQGVADFNDIAFTDNSSWVRSGKFRLGAKVVKNVSTRATIREAISGAFSVKERRGEHSQKKGTPSLNDEVWRLHNIARNGPIHKRLEDENIHLVKDLINRYQANTDSLKKILQVSDKKFQDIIRQTTSACSMVEHCGNYTGAYWVQDTTLAAGKDTTNLAYENGNQLLGNYGLSLVPLPTETISSAIGSSANIQLLDASLANIGESEMQLSFNCSSANVMLSQPEPPLDKIQDLFPAPQCLSDWNSDDFTRFVEIDINPINMSTSNTEGVMCSSDEFMTGPRLCFIRVAKKVIMLRRFFVLTKPATRPRKKQKV